MPSLPDKLDLLDLPAYVQSWSAARIPGFVLAVLNRWQRNYGELPARFSLVICPQVEINAIGGLPPQVQELTDPKLRCRHFTGCNKPYFVVIFTGTDADTRRAEAQRYLPWSEGYSTEIGQDAVKMILREAVEDVEEETQTPTTGRSLRQLLESGELISILA